MTRPDTRRPAGSYLRRDERPSREERHGQLHDSCALPAEGEPEKDSGVLVKVVALFLGIAVAVLAVAVVVMMQATDEARDEAKAAGQPAATTTRSTTTRANSSAVSLPLQSFAGTTAENAEELAMAHTATDATLPPIPAGDLVRVHMTLKDMVVEIAPGVKYNTWAFDGHGAPGPVVHVREGQTVEMTLTNGGSIPHSIDFHAARIAPNLAFRDAAPGESFTFRFTASDPGVFMYHCGTKPVLAHIANGMYGAIIVEPKAGLPPVDNEYVLVGSEWYLNGAGHRRARVARHGEGALEDGRLGHVQRLREPVRHPPADRKAGRHDALLGRRRRSHEQRQLPRRRHDLRPRLGQLRPDDSAPARCPDGRRPRRRRRGLRRQDRRRGPLSRS